MKRNLLILGAGGHGKVVLDVAKSTGAYDQIYFLDSGKVKGEKVLGHEIIDSIENTYNYKEENTDAIVAVGHNVMRVNMTHVLEIQGFHVPTLIHPQSVVSPYAKIEKGTVIMPGAVINAAAQVGEACIINTGAIIEHDCIVGDGCHISDRAVVGGGSKLGECVMLDIGAVVGRNSEIEDSAVIR